MGLKLLSISAGCTILNLVGLQYWKQMSLENYKPDGLIVEDLINSDRASHSLELLLSLFSTPALVASFALNVFIFIILCLKMIFFSELYSSEIRKLLERLINYIIYKGIFLPLVVQPTIFQIGLWSTWLGVVCFLKMFQALARDRLERLNASPSATPWTYFRAYSALLLVFSVDLLWMWLCFTIYSATSLSVSLLLFFEPSSIAFETLQAMVVHGFQLLEIWVHHSAGDIANFRLSKIFDISPAGSTITIGSLWEWKGILIRNLGFFLDMMTLLMSIAHYLHIWLLHGMAFHLVDAVLFLNIRALLSACVKRAKSFIKLRMALGTLHGALPDATHEELRAYDDECAICREPMAKAKKLSCNHLFHLACLRSWLDQGLTENYSCPTCRKPLFMDQPENGVSPRAAEISRDEQLAREMSAVLERPNLPGHNLPFGALPNQPQNLENGDQRRTGIESRWLGLDGAGPSGFGRVQMVMRQLAAVGETALEDAAWGLFPPNPSQAGTSRTGTPPPGPLRYPGGSGGLSMRSPSHALNDDIANILIMAETVREVLPHIPDDLIFQDLQQTNSVMVTVNNLLQM
ncbi:E3 ubiquitin ligase RIN2 [Olea europaea subsp. europaea]|uniref:E3 ubiquitin ligase RIN2 n=1 Tax=Olea europaea subsp. europaea TaxID=158383 RepID=A0A8S0S948_OLEEU|nr:E3 ubiquitin ligase RIN2 [Olea europaea subsp. europaea]CAA2988667.1 E3 ubiquitin ligase RIN2 [Olea europaea subsp. europaea]